MKSSEKNKKKGFFKEYMKPILIGIGISVGGSIIYGLGSETKNIFSTAIGMPQTVERLEKQDSIAKKERVAIKDGSLLRDTFLHERIERYKTDIIEKVNHGDSTINRNLKDEIRNIKIFIKNILEK